MDPPAAESEFEMVQRHVREGVSLLANQRALVARLRTAGLPIVEAEMILLMIEKAQRTHEDHLARITRDGKDHRAATRD